SSPTESASESVSSRRARSPARSPFRRPRAGREPLRQRQRAGADAWVRLYKRGAQVPGRRERAQSPEISITSTETEEVQGALECAWKKKKVGPPFSGGETAGRRQPDESRCSSS